LAQTPKTDSAAKVTYPVVSEKSCPPELISVTAADGHKATAVVRKPPGIGPFPAIVFLHGGLNERNVDRVKREAPTMPTNSRFLAVGYVTVEAVFRSRSDDPQSKDALTDCLAILAHVKKLPGVDPKSVVILGHSGGGSLALELAGETELAAIVAGEPASIIFTGMYNKQTRRRPEQAKLMDDPKHYYTPELQKFTREKIQRITCPVLIVHGDQHPINKINHEIIIPELKAAGKDVEVILYLGQPHTFVFAQEGSPEAALKCFNDCDAFVRRYIKIQPTPLDRALIKDATASGEKEKRRRGKAAEPKAADPL
jgi:dipeptidyl aminopeptidase/acylaminoacyl peptidase